MFLGGPGIPQCIYIYIYHHHDEVALSNRNNLKIETVPSFMTGASKFHTSEPRATRPNLREIQEPQIGHLLHGVTKKRNIRNK
jgi:hypothetical protein